MAPEASGTANGSVSQRVVLITGANSGIGYDLSAALVESPENHVIMGCRNYERGARALQRLQAQPHAGSLSLLEVDITDDQSIGLAVEKLTFEFGVVDVLVNNAGAVMRNFPDRRSEILDTINTNSVGHLVFTEALEPLLQKSSDPRIINVSSGLGSINARLDPNDSTYRIASEAYRMSKAALNMATACMYANYKVWGAKVWAYCPGNGITNLTGAGESRGRSESTGAVSFAASAAGIVDIVQGTKDGDVGRFLQVGGRILDW
ncbi:short chain dehydrogenase [Metarhizium album ARSEF 1941]|uniref:Short chain dehydrogenase n=1 Tax=Metarhizium album (strain ARSEF 1941) TaxID=1081103 RepID=A0A0B2WVV2_METAS|nr:short chain dehydrogenase [Metarhizium album ARSEF 1941]KHO00252.1 short chain dehydrogenase [Metarhizium album ARSEF 1941]